MIVDVAVWPAVAFMLVGLAVTVKSVTVMVTVVELVEQQCVTSLAVTVIVHVVKRVVLVGVAVKVPVPDPTTL